MHKTDRLTVEADEFFRLRGKPLGRPSRRGGEGFGLCRRSLGRVVWLDRARRTGVQLGVVGLCCIFRQGAKSVVLVLRV